jgi:hypothetical protein
MGNSRVRRAGALGDRLIPTIERRLYADQVSSFVVAVGPLEAVSTTYGWRAAMSSNYNLSGSTCRPRVDVAHPALHV